MIQKEILEYNKRCAEFLGANIQDDSERIYIDKMKDDDMMFHNMSVNLGTYEWNGTTNIHYIPFDMLEFHSDWNSIMEVVEAIEKLGFNFNIFHEDCLIKKDRKYVIVTNATKIKSKKEAVVQAINQFLIWYEQNK